LKNRKNRPALGALLPNRPPMPLAAGSYVPIPHISHFSLTDIDYPYYKL